MLDSATWSRSIRVNCPNATARQCFSRPGTHASDAHDCHMRPAQRLGTRDAVQAFQARKAAVQVRAKASSGSTMQEPGSA